MDPAVDVVVLTWNDPEDLATCVASVLASRDVDVQLIVVDNGSDPPASVPDDHRVQLIRNQRNLGVPAGRNVGIDAGERPYVCILDSDATVEPGCLAKLVVPLEQHPDVAMSCPVFAGQAPEIGAGRHPSVARKVARGLGLTDKYASTRRAPGDPWWDVDFAIGACQLIRRSALDEVGTYDESHLFGPEDVDLSARLRAAGLRIVQVRDPGCHHVARRSHRRLLSRRGLRHMQAVGRYYTRRLAAGSRRAP